jgi:hypothetical protein
VQVLVEGASKRGSGLLFGRTESFQSIQIPSTEIPDSLMPGHRRLPAAGDFVEVDVAEADNGRLEGLPRRICSLTQFFSKQEAHEPALLQLPPPVQRGVHSSMDAVG